MVGLSLVNQAAHLSIQGYVSRALMVLVAVHFLVLQWWANVCSWLY